MTEEKYRLRVFYRRKGRIVPEFLKWKPWDECTPEEQRLANLRTLWPSEVVLDFEQRGAWKKHSNLLKGYDFKVWFSGSRGDHLHITFDEMKKYPKDVRNRIRKLFISQFVDADLTKASENGLISIEGKCHHKSGEPKVLILDHKAGEEIE